MASFLAATTTKRCVITNIVTDTIPEVVPITDKKFIFAFEEKKMLSEFAGLNMDLVKRWKINGSFDPRIDNHETYKDNNMPVSRFTKHVKLYPNVTICIEGQVDIRESPPYHMQEYIAVLKLKLSKVEDDSPDLKHVLVCLHFANYKEDTQEIIASWNTPKFQDQCWINDGVSFRHQYAEEISPEELDSLYQIQLVIKIPRKTSSTLVEDVQKLFSNRDQFNDVTIICGLDEEKFACHKAILAVRSNVFSAMFNMVESSENQTGVVKVNDINGKTMKSLLKYIYQDRVEEEDVDVDLLLAADKYDLPGKGFFKSNCPDRLF
jgi:hypothetical protein